MKIRNLFFILVSICIFCFTPIFIYAQLTQRLCGTDIPDQRWENEFQKLIADFKSGIQSNKASITSYTIPVIFHVIHGGQSVGTFPNLLQGQINSQITVLNQDFTGSGYNAGNYPSNAFVNWVINQGLPAANIDGNGRVKIADLNIHFCLATKDTLGNILQEPGIDRINYITRGWLNPNTFTTTTALRAYMDGTIKPHSIWNVTKYFNIWVTDKNAAIPYTGYATMPPLSTLPGIQGVGTDTTDGVWSYAGAVGSTTIFPSGTYASPNVKGRTITHETGHYLGMRHIWGDGTCATDYCNDTPPASLENTGFPTYPWHAGSCSSPSNAPDGEMFMNFMDYSADPSKYMFTVDQTIRAQTAMVNSPFRNLLGTHGLCVYTGIFNTFDYSSVVDIFPNPTNDFIYIKMEDQDLVNVKIYNISGELLLIRYSSAFSLKDLPAGIYFICVQTDKISLHKKIIKQ
jgi:hypothetical protein